MKKHYHYMNGKILQEAKVNISVYDLGFLRGYGVFDFIRTYNRTPFLLKEHLMRLENSAKLLDIKIPITRKKITEIIKTLIEKNKHKEATKWTN